VDLLDAGDAAGLRDWLQQHSLVARQHIAFEGGNYFRNPTLLEFVAENPIRHGALPQNILEVTKVILDAGVEQSALNETLGLVATGSMPRECGMQRALIDLLCDHRADPNSAIRAAAALGELEAVNALLQRGARIDLPVAAALGRIDDFRRMLPAAGHEDRHLSFALASQLNQVEIVRLLLGAGENPDRYNPVGCHSHSAPLHQAAGAGHEALVRLLVEHGARLDLKDILWHGTPADWARHEGRPEIEAYLRAREARVAVP
jgi:hypothetical protein